MLRFVGNGDQKKFTKNPRHFSMQNSQANTEKKFTKCFWRGGKVTNARKRAQMSAKERKRKSATERRRAQEGAKECKRALPRKNCKQPGLKQPGSREYQDKDSGTF